MNALATDGMTKRLGKTTTVDGPSFTVTQSEPFGLLGKQAGQIDADQGTRSPASTEQWTYHLYEGRA